MSCPQPVNSRNPCVLLVKISLRYFSAEKGLSNPWESAGPIMTFTGGSPNDWALVEYFPWETEEELADYRLEPLGISFKEAATEKYVIRSDEPWTYETINPKTGEPTGFATPSGKIELYSNVLKELGYDPLPFMKNLRRVQLEPLKLLRIILSY